MFKILAVLLVLGCAYHANSAPAPEEKYTDKYDNINVDDILASKRLLKSYLTCLLDKGICTPEASELKRLLPDALKTACSKCTEKQKVGAAKIVERVTTEYPAEWKELSLKWDPTGEYWAKYKPLIQEYMVATKTA